MVKVLTFPDYFAHRLLYAHRSNYHGPRRGNASWVAIHTVQGSYSSCVNWFRNGSANVSAHYVVAANGHTTQMVGENMIAWHVGSHNPYTIGIEHEGYAHDGHPPTQAMYHASAKLTAGICRRHNIPVSRVIGHRDFRGATHTDPGNEWNMGYYRKLVTNYLKGEGSSPKPAPEPDTVFRVIAGSFGSKENADARARDLERKGFGESWVYKSGRNWRVQVASFNDRDSANKSVAALDAKGFDAFLVAESPKE